MGVVLQRRMTGRRRRGENGGTRYKGKDVEVVHARKSLEHQLLTSSSEESPFPWMGRGSKSRICSNVVVRPVDTNDDFRSDRASRQSFRLLTGLTFREIRRNSRKLVQSRCLCLLRTLVCFQRNKLDGMDSYRSPSCSGCKRYTDRVI